MKKTKNLMGMHVTVEVSGGNFKKAASEVFSYFKYVDGKFSTYKRNSEVSKISRGLVKKSQFSRDMQTVLRLAEVTKRETNSYFDIWNGGVMDPSGIVKGWAIFEAAKILKGRGVGNFYIDAGGDIQTKGRNLKGKAWTVGIKNPFNTSEIVKVVGLSNGEGIATSGAYERGEHIYNPKGELDKYVKSMTVIGPNVLEADRFATAAFAMGREGISFIEDKPGLEGYMIGSDGVATFTSGFSKYVVSDS